MQIGNSLIENSLKGHWLLGSTLDFASDTLGFVQRCIEEYPGGIVRTRIAFRDFFLLLKPEYITHVLQKNHRNYRKSFAYDGLKPFLGQGLLTSEGSHWLRQRRLAQPAFHREQLHTLIGDMAQATAIYLESWQPGQTIHIHSEMGQLTQDIISRAVFGATADDLPEVDRIGGLLPVLRTYANDRMKNPLMPPLWWPNRYNRRFRQTVEQLQTIVLRAIRLRRHAPRQDATLLGMLMQAHTDEAMTDAQLYDEIVTIFIAGQETTTNAMGFLLLLLAQHPEAFARVAEEATPVIAAGPDLHNVYQLQWTWQVVQEALRMYPPAWAVSRQAIAADNIGGTTIPAGATAFLSVYAMHHHASYWEAPAEFRPERFAGDNYPKAAYLPFGAGPRKCIGSHFALLEMVIILAHLAVRFRLELKSDPQPKLITPMTMSTRDPILFQLHTRS
ncbi:MAG: cytochrome P450 [Bacteroidota bacterium]